jgi:hypothetical protein
MPKSIYKTPEGEAEIRTLYDEALAELGLGYESLTVGTRLGDTHVLALGPEDSPPAVFLPGGNALNPTCLKWFLPLAEHHRLYAVHGARGSRFHPRRPPARSGPPAPPAGRRSPPDGHRGGTQRLQRTCCGVRLRG